MEELDELETLTKHLCLDIKLYRTHDGIWELYIINSGDNKDIPVGDVYNGKCDDMSWVIRDANSVLTYFKH